MRIIDNTAAPIIPKNAGNIGHAIVFKSNGITYITMSTSGMPECPAVLIDLTNNVTYPLKNNMGMSVGATFPNTEVILK